MRNLFILALLIFLPAGCVAVDGEGVTNNAWLVKQAHYSLDKACQFKRGASDVVVGEQFVIFKEECNENNNISPSRYYVVLDAHSLNLVSRFPDSISEKTNCLGFGVNYDLDRWGRIVRICLPRRGSVSAKDWQQYELKVKSIEYDRHGFSVNDTRLFSATDAESFGLLKSRVINGDQYYLSYTLSQYFGDMRAAVQIDRFRILKSGEFIPLEFEQGYISPWCSEALRCAVLDIAPSTNNDIIFIYRVWDHPDQGYVLARYSGLDSESQIVATAYSDNGYNLGEAPIARGRFLFMLFRHDGGLKEDSHRLEVRDINSLDLVAKRYAEGLNTRPQVRGIAPIDNGEKLLVLSGQEGLDLLVSQDLSDLGKIPFPRFLIQNTPYDLRATAQANEILLLGDGGMSRYLVNLPGDVDE